MTATTVVVLAVLLTASTACATLLIFRYRRRHEPALKTARRATRALAKECARNNARRRSATFEPAEQFEPNLYWG